MLPVDLETQRLNNTSCSEVALALVIIRDMDARIKINYTGNPRLLLTSIEKKSPIITSTFSYNTEVS